MRSQRQFLIKLETEQQLQVLSRDRFLNEAEAGLAEARTNLEDRMIAEGHDVGVWASRVCEIHQSQWIVGE